MPVTALIRCVALALAMAVLLVYLAERLHA